MWTYAVTLLLGSLAVLFIHELGHLLVARALGVDALSVTIGVGPTIVQFTDGQGTHWKLGLLPFGAGCGFRDDPASLQAGSHLQFDAARSLRGISLRQRAIMFLAGPLSNALLAGALFLATYAQDNNFSIARLGKAEASPTLLIGVFSLAVGLFNLLPILPLDGGRLALLVFEAFTGREISRTSERQLFTSGVVVLSITAALAILLFVVVPILRID